MLGLFKRKRAVGVDAALECVVGNIGEYLSSRKETVLDEAFSLLFKVVQECDEHVQSQLKPIMKKYEELVSSSIGIYDGFLYMAAQVINYCLLYMRNGGVLR